MPLAIFGIDSNAANLVVSFVILSLVAIWIALVVFTWNDSRRRVEDPFLVGCATFASFIFPFFGTIIYTIVRPGEYLEDAHERELEVRDTEARLRHHEANSCRKCGAPTQPDFIKCPSCRTRLKQPCPSCSKPVGLNWKLCPYCEKTLIEPKRSSRRGASKSEEKEGRGRRKDSTSKASSKSKAGPAGKPADSGKTSSAEKTTAAATGEKPDRGSNSRSFRRRAKASPESEAATEAVRPERSDAPDSSGRSSRPSRRRAAVADDDPGSRPINSGDAVPKEVAPKGEDAGSR